MTADGKIATRTGASKWITGEERENVCSTAEKIYSGIMVGIGTVLADDPMLTCRLENAKNPVRIICDSSLRIPLDSNIVKDGERSTDHHSLHDSKEDKEKSKQDLIIEEKIEKLQQAGCEVLPIGRTKTGVDLKELMKPLGEKGIDSILLEGREQPELFGTTGRGSYPK